MTIDASYWMEAQWGARPETPEALAGRFLRTVDAIRPLHPLLDIWTWGDLPEVWESEGDAGIHPFATVRTNMVRAIERNVGRDDERKPEPFYGYCMPIQTDRTPPESRFDVSVSAARDFTKGWAASAFANYANVEIGPKPEPSLITFDLWRSVMLIMAETWEATWAEASPMNIRPFWTGIPVRLAWMNYVSPRFAPLITPPASAIVEVRPNGGLFLAATDETFLTTNPAHMAAAHAIEAALQPLNQIPIRSMIPINEDRATTASPAYALDLAQFQ